MTDTAEIDARIDAVCAELGIEPLPWQRAYLRAVMRGERPVIVRGRKAGFTTLQRIATDALARLDGTDEAAVSLMTGLSREEIRDLVGDYPDDTTTDTEGEGEA